MERSDKRNLPAQPAANVPATSRTFSTTELEAVIRRAVELQAGNPARADDGLSEVDIVRIGQDLGLDPATVRRAIAEVRSRPAEERQALARLVGGRSVLASRVVQRPAAKVAPDVDRHLRDAELMIVQRRFPDRTRYVHDSSIAAGLARFGRTLSRAHRPLNLKQLDVAVSALDAESCLVEVGVDLGVTRGGLAAGVLGSGTAVAAGWTTTVWATAIADPLMLLGIPIVAGSWYGMRAIYNTIRRSTQEKLEALLDRVEHDDLP